MKSKNTPLFYFVSMVFLLPPAFGFSQNLIQNGGFEIATPVGWPSGNSLTPYPYFTDGWAPVDVDGE